MLDVVHFVDDVSAPLSYGDPDVLLVSQHDFKDIEVVGDSLGLVGSSSHARDWGLGRRARGF